MQNRVRPDCAREKSEAWRDLGVDHGENAKLEADAEAGEAGPISGELGNHAGGRVLRRTRKSAKASHNNPQRLGRHFCVSKSSFLARHMRAGAPIQAMRDVFVAFPTRSEAIQIRGAP